MSYLLIIILIVLIILVIRKRRLNITYRNYIYLDWNVIQYMKHKDSSVNGEAFEELVSNLSSTYRFPWSEGHLRDLKISYSEKNNHYVLEDIEYLDKISKSYALVTLTPKDKEKRANEILGVTKNKNIKRFFYKKILPDVKSKIEFISESNNQYDIDIDIDTDKMRNSDIFKEKIVKNNNIYDSSVMIDSMEELVKNMNNPDYYKKLRKEVSVIGEKFKDNSNTVLNQNTAYFEGITPFFDFFKVVDDSNIEDSFKKAIFAFLSINKRNYEGMTTGERIEIAYALLDFHPLYRDRVTKKNKPSNILRDSKNLYYASGAEFYVTEDKDTLKKSLLVVKVLSLNVKVVNMSTFLRQFEGSEL